MRLFRYDYAYLKGFEPCYGERMDDSDTENMKTKRRNRTIILIVLLLLLLAGIVFHFAMKDHVATQPMPSAQFESKDRNNKSETVPLINTYWRLVTLNAKPVKVYTAEAHFVLEGGTGRFHGSSGCNRIRGEYKSGPTALTFSTPVATTRMMCAEGAKQETDFLTALQEVRSWGISEDNLMLLNGQGRMIARFKQQLMQ